MKLAFLWITGFSVLIVAGFIILKIAVSPQTSWLKDEQKRSLATIVTKFSDPWYQIISIAKDDKLPTYQVTITGSDINQLLTSTPKDKRLILTNAAKKNIPASVKYENEAKLKAKLSLHGEFWPHWWNRKKSFSLRLEQDTLKNNTKFSFILPEERGYIDEAAGIILAQKIGLVTPQFEFAHLRINNSDQGVYFVTEEFTSEFLHQISQDPITVYAEDEVNLDQPISLYSSKGKWKILATTASTETFIPVDELKRIYALRDDQEFFFQAEKLFDLDQVLKWQALSMLLGDHHQDDYHNNRLLYNHTTNKLSFIPEDVYIFSTEHNLTKVYPHNSLMQRLLKNHQWRALRNQILLKFLQSGEMDNLYQQLTKTENYIRKAIYYDTNKYPSNYHYTQQVKLKLRAIQGNKYFLLEKLQQDFQKFDL